MNAWDDNFKKLQKQDTAAANAKTLVGRYIKEGYADGYAFYKITKENKSTVRIEVITGLGDDWRIPYWGDAALIPKDYARKSIQRREGLAKLFGGKE